MRVYNSSRRLKSRHPTPILQWYMPCVHQHTLITSSGLTMQAATRAAPAAAVARARSVSSVSSSVPMVLDAKHLIPKEARLRKQHSHSESVPEQAQGIPRENNLVSKAVITAACTRNALQAVKETRKLQCTLGTLPEASPRILLNHPSSVGGNTLNHVRPPNSTSGASGNLAWLLNVTRNVLVAPSMTMRLRQG